MIIMHIGAFPMNIHKWANYGQIKAYKFTGVSESIGVSLESSYAV